MRAGPTHATHMHPYIVYPVLIGFCATFLTLGLRKFRSRVLS
jgi:ABC-2 type transport system permease protein